MNKLIIGIPAGNTIPGKGLLILIGTISHPIHSSIDKWKNFNNIGLFLPVIINLFTEFVLRIPWRSRNI